MSWSTVRVPASSANLGPGFDALGLALCVYLDCRFRPSDHLSIVVTGRDAAAIPTGEDNLIWQTALSVATDVRMPLPPIELVIDNQIPLGKGLGSSAAALTAGVVIADRLLGLGWRPPRILDEAARLEGHPDNVAACVLGSIVASAIDSGGAVRAVRLELPARFGMALVVLIRTAYRGSARRPSDVLQQGGCGVQRPACRTTHRGAGCRSHVGVPSRARRPFPPTLSRAAGARPGRTS